MKKTLLSIITLATFSFGATAQDVSIPDANFKAYLLGNTSINTDADPNEISVAEASAFTGTINCNNLTISDLTGIEAFTDLSELYCQNNSISNLDVSFNTDLIVLYCAFNLMSSVDLSNNIAITHFRCNDNINFNNLDVSNNINLTFLDCSATSIINLDLSNNSLITLFNCHTTSLTSLNLANGNNTIITTILLQNNPSLSCIEVDDVSYSASNWTNINNAISFSLDCGYIVSSITVQGQAGASTITTLAASLQMEAFVLPTYANDATYTWSVTNGTGSASIDASGLLAAITDGTVTVTATAIDASGITGSTVITISNQSSVGINEKTNISSLSIYPNPVNSQLTIDFEAEIVSITILNVMGKTVKTFVSSSNTIDVSDLTKGIYFLQIETDKALVSTKFIKE
jgi:Leucine-rich repeat (LRR) protein